jgi:hypothetical protein
VHGNSAALRESGILSVRPRRFQFLGHAEFADDEFVKPQLANAGAIHGEAPDEDGADAIRWLAAPANFLSPSE